MSFSEPVRRHANAVRAAFAIALAALLFAVFFWQLSPAQAQQHADFADSATIDSKTQTLYTSQNGLPSTVVTAVAQTSNGFIWIGGYRGLTSFDGQEFEQQTQAPNFSVESLLAEDDGSLWIGTTSQGLYRYSNGQYEPVDCSSCDMNFGEVLCMAKMADGSIALGTEHGIAFVDQNGQACKSSFKGMPDTPVRDLAASNQDCLMAVTQDGRLFKISGNKAKEVPLSDVSGSPRSISYSVDAESFYVGTNQNTVATLSHTGSQQSTCTIAGAANINDVSVSNEGVVWVCADNGVYSVYNNKTTKQHLQMDNSIDSMLIDAEGNYWFASSRQGILLVGNTPFLDITSYADMNHCVVNALAEYRGKLLVGTEDGIDVIDPNTGKAVSTARFKAVDDLRVRDIKTDSAGRLWVATSDGGVFRMSKSGQWTAYTKENSKAITTNNFRSLYETDSMMLAGSEEGAIVIDKKGVRNALADPSTLNARVMSVSKMGDVLLFGTDNYGLQLVKDGKIIGSFTTDDGLPSNSILKVYPCTNKTDALLVTSSGLVKLSLTQGQQDKAESKESFALANIDSFPSFNTLDAVWENNETVWVATGNGIYRTTEANLLNNQAESAKPYTRQDGLPYDMTANSTQLLDGDLLYLAGTGGVSAINTKEAAAATDDCTPSISGAYVDGTFIPVDSNNTLTIPADTERVKIMAHATTFNKANITLYYKLDGYDSHETTTPLLNFNGLEYTNLNGGSYQLHFGAWDESAQAPLDSVSVTIKKEYGLLDHPLTRVLEIALIVGLVALGFIWRRKRLLDKLQREYREKERRALEKMAFSDFLTDAYNRNYLNAWEQAAHRKDCQFPLSLITIDLNNLKQINDTMGHSAGDEYLRSAIRAIFGGFGDEGVKVIRMGGDEFLIIAEGLTQNQAVKRIAKTREILAESSANGLEYGLCFGAVQIDTPEFKLDQKLREADAQMMEEKRRYHESHDRRTN